MTDSQFIQGLSPNLKKAVCWISETVQKFPEKTRVDVLKEAELRFDLNPRECEFINNNFAKLPAKCNDQAS